MSESKTQCPLCHNFENHQAGCRIGTLELELNEALKWKNEDPRMLREQIKVADNAFNGLTERYNKLESQLTTAQQDLAKIANALRTQQQRYHDLSEEVEGLKKDKERYNFYKNHHGEFHHCPGEEWRTWVPGNKPFSKGHWKFLGNTLDEAIDSAMKGTK